MEVTVVVVVDWLVDVMVTVVDTVTMAVTSGGLIKVLCVVVTADVTVLVARGKVVVFPPI